MQPVVERCGFTEREMVRLVEDAIEISWAGRAREGELAKEWKMFREKYSVVGD